MLRQVTFNEVLSMVNIVNTLLKVKATYFNTVQHFDITKYFFDR